MFLRAIGAFGISRGIVLKRATICRVKWPKVAKTQALASAPQPDLAAEVQQIFGRPNFTRHVERLIAPFQRHAAAEAH